MGGDGDRDRGRDGGRGEERSVLGKVIAILDAFDADQPVLRLSELCERTGLARSTVHRTAEQLVEHGWLERVVGGYRLGMRLFELGGQVVRWYQLREAALPFMQDLYEATHEVVHLAILDGYDVVYVDKIGGHHSVDVPSRVGGRLPAYCTGVGKAMLAFAPAETIDGVLERGLQAWTATSLVDKRALLDELATIRVEGIAVDRGEAVRGVRCVAAPIRGAGRALAAVSVTGPEPQIDPVRLGPAVRVAASGIWRAMFPRSRGPDRPPAAKAGQPASA